MLKRMNDMSMQELIETENKLNWLVRQHEDAFVPTLPEWARAIEDDIQYQEEAGAFTDDFETRCPVCGEWMDKESTFCSPECRILRMNGYKLSEIQKKREETEKWLKK